MSAKEETIHDSMICVHLRPEHGEEKDLKVPQTLSVKQFCVFACRLVHKRPQFVELRLLSSSDRVLRDGFKTLRESGVEDGAIVAIVDSPTVVLLNCLVCFKKHETEYSSVTLLDVLPSHSMLACMWCDLA